METQGLTRPWFHSKSWGMGSHDLTRTWLRKVPYKSFLYLFICVYPHMHKQHIFPNAPLQTVGWTNLLQLNSDSRCQAFLLFFNSLWDKVLHVLCPIFLDVLENELQFQRRHPIGAQQGDGCFDSESLSLAPSTFLWQAPARRMQREVRHPSIPSLCILLFCYLPQAITESRRKVGCVPRGERPVRYHS